MRSLIILLISLITLSSTQAQSVMDTIKRFPILDQGRVKPLNTFARESAYEIAGRENPFTMTGIEFLLMLLDNPDKVTLHNFIRLDNAELKTEFGFPVKEKYFNFQQFLKQPNLSSLFDQVRDKANRKEKLSPRDEAVRKIEHSLHLVSGIMSGELLALIPDPINPQVFLPLSSLEVRQNPERMKLVSSFVKIARGYNEKTPELMLEGSAEYAQALAQNWKPSEKLQSQFDQEVFYLDFKPYRKAALFYGFSLLMIGFFLQFKSQNVIKAMAQACFWVGFVLHTYALGLRVYILDRPPVSNMYESVVFMAWAAAVIFLITQWRRFDGIYHLAASLCGCLTLVMADLLPMNSSLGVLEAVLRSNYWLIIHVMTIVASYGAYSLAAVLAHFYIVMRMVGSKPETIKSTFKLLLNSIYVGSVLLVAGLILGGVWANESWGRFWGWDPKETWSLITFLGYMAVLHARKAGKIRELGVVLWSLICYILVIMTWYGVNYIIGAGLHSYGFGSGGTHWFWLFVAVETSIAAISGWILTRKKPQPIAS